MLPDASNHNALGRYLTIGHVGMEMVVPIGAGLLLDHYLGWSPWGVVGGAVLGLVVGLVVLVRLANKEERKPSSNHKPEAK